MNFDKPEMLDFLPQNGISEAPGSLMENLTGAFDAMKYTGGAGANSRGYTLLDVWTPIIDELNETGADFENPAIWLFDSMSSRYDGKADEIYSYIQNNKESLPESLSEINPASVDEMMKSFVQQKESEFAELSRSNPGFFPAAARFVGGMGAGGGDPVTAATMPFGGWSKTLWKNIAQSAAVNAGAGAISELDVKDWYDELGLEYGYEEFLQNVAMQAAFGAAIPAAGAGIRMTADQALKGWDVLKGKMKKPLSAEDQALVDKLESQADIEESNPLQSENGIEAESEHEARLSDATAALAGDTAPRMPDEPSSPIKGTIPLQDELNALDKKWLENNAKLKAAEAEGLKIQDRLNDAFDVDPNLTKDSKIVKDLMDENKLNQSEVDEFRSIQDGLGGQRVKILEAQEQKLALIDNGADNLDGVIFKYNPDEIGIDAKTFQFKSGGDEFGVTERLQDTVWDKNLAGTITVYEYADGRVVVSDGHQRLGLAKRIKAQDPSQEITLYAYKDREVDGVSPIQSRVQSAIKNIANADKDTYNPQLVIDAAKVLREATNNPNISADIINSLPPKSQVVKQAQGMMRLGDDAFMAIINGVIPPNYAAIIGRLIDDPDLQSAAVSVLAKSNPDNAFEAEAIIRQVKESDFEQVKQIDLFGEQIVTESYFVERAKILDKAYKELRRDKAAFETLVRNSERLEAEGNVLVKDVNKKKADTDGQTIALLQTLANRKGPLSDALNDAARTARDTGSYVEATGGFLDAIRGSIESGDFERLSTGDVGRAVDGPTEITRSEATAEPALEGFDEPTGIAAERQANQLVQDMFGADEVDTPPAAVTPEDVAMQSALQQAQDEIKPDWRPYMFMEDSDTLVDINSVLPVKVRPEGVVNSLSFMVQSANNEIPKRGSLLLRDNGDGTFSVRDGNSTYSIAKAAGWPELPGKIIDDAQYASELSRKAADRILNQDALGKNKMRYVVAETLGKDEADIFVERLLERQRFKTGLGLFRKAKKNNETLNKAAGQAAADLGIEFEPATVKKLKRIEEKVRDKYQGKYNRLTDAARTGINAATMEEADAFVKALSKKFHLVDEGWKVTPAGYFDRKLMVIFDDKSLGEIQIWPPGMLKAKGDPTLFEKSGHDYYEISRSVDSTDVEIADANQKMIEIYGAVTSTLDQSFAQKLGTGAPRASSVDSTLSSEISSEPSSVTTARASSLEPPTGIQPSSLSQSMPSGPSIAAIEPKSNLNNFIDDTSSANLDITLPDVKSGDIFDDMDLEVPVGQRFNEETGLVESTTMTMRDLKAQLDAEDSMITRLEFCTV